MSFFWRGEGIAFLQSFIHARLDTLSLISRKKYFLSVVA